MEMDEVALHNEKMFKQLMSITYQRDEDEKPDPIDKSKTVGMTKPQIRLFKKRTQKFKKGAIYRLLKNMDVHFSKLITQIENWEEAWVEKINDKVIEVEKLKWERHLL